MGNPDPLIQHHVHGHLVGQRSDDGYINATAMCKAAGKEWSNYRQNKSTRAFIYELALDLGIPRSKLIWHFRGRPADQQGTWVHPHLAIHLGQWISPMFAVRVSSIVIDWMNGLQRHHAMERLLLPDPDTWEKVFPDEFYVELYRLKGWVWQGMSVNRYQACAQYTNDIVWDRIEDGLREELENRNPMLPSGERASRHHQHLRDQAEKKLKDSRTSGSTSGSSARA